MDALANEQCRDGAFEWDLFENVAEESRFVATFMLNSWIEHLRHPEWVTNADRVVQAWSLALSGRRRPESYPFCRAGRVLRICPFPVLRLFVTFQVLGL